MEHPPKSIRNSTSGKPLAIRLLNGLSKLLPGDYLKTAVYMNFISKPRKTLNQFINGFYRIDHIYEVLQEAKNPITGIFPFWNLAPPTVMPSQKCSMRPDILA